MTDGDDGGDRPDSPDTWIDTAKIWVFIRRVWAARQGGPSGPDPSPALAQHYLRVFARRRSSADLLRCIQVLGRAGDRVDVVMLPTLAAMRRTPSEAADLTVTMDRQKRPELRDSIIHDFVRQRETPDVASFIASLHDSASPGLAEQALTVFAQPGSGRTGLDKALLYMELRQVGGRESADWLLNYVLRIEAKTGAVLPMPCEPDVLQDLVGSFWRLSPAETLVEDWIEAEVNAGGTRAGDVQPFACRLIRDRGDEAARLLLRIGEDWPVSEITQACLYLNADKSGESAGAFRRILESTSLPWLPKRLADLIYEWWQVRELKDRQDDLLAAVVRPGEDALPREDKHLRKIIDALSRHTGLDSAMCADRLYRAAATSVRDRPAADIVSLLSAIDNRRQLALAQRGAGDELARLVLRGTTAPEVMVQFVIGLQDQGWRREAEDALRAITMSPDGVGGTSRANRPEIVAAVAAGLYSAGRARSMAGLLERYLEAEHQLDPRDVADMISRLRSGVQGGDLAGLDDELKRLLRATVGRWNDASEESGRAGVRSALSEQGLSWLADMLSR